MDQNNTPQDRERRQQKRIPVALWVTQEFQKEICHCHAADLSQGGLRFISGLPYTIGTQVTLEFQLTEEEPPIRVRAQIMDANWIEEKPVTNLRFLDLAEQDRVRIQNFIDNQS